MDFTDYTFAQLEQMILERDEHIKKLQLKVQKKRQIIIDLKNKNEKDNIIDVLFEETESEDSKPDYTGEQITNTMTFFDKNYQWLPEEFLDPNKRCITSINDIMNGLRDWGRCLGIRVQGDDRQILTRPQLIQYLRDENKTRYNHRLKWKTAKYEQDSEKYPNGSRNIPYFHCLKK